METKTRRIRALNDKLRRTLTDGTVVMTPGIAALGREEVERIVKTIALFDDFCHANDPHEEHDFGSFEADGHGSTSKSTTLITISSTTRQTHPTLP